MTAASQLIGYDIRRAPSTYLSTRWGSAERERFLIHPDTPCPLSVDRLVWPSRFRLESTPPGLLSAPDDIVLTSDPRHRYFKLFDLWDDMDEMVSEYRPTEPGDCGVAIGILPPPPESEPANDAWWHAIKGCTVHPSHRQATWESLGYDIANSGFTSALSSCGRTPQERAESEMRWRAHLNAYGLFMSFSEAALFCLDANSKIADDGPFYVFEIFLLWGTLQPG